MKRNYHHLNNLTLLLATTALITGCATNDATRVKLTKATTSKPVVAVLPFETPNLKNLPKDDQKVRMFERSYFAARLIQPLQANKAIGKAYFSAAVTPAADFNVISEIKKSDGKMIVVEIDVKSASGKVIWGSSFSVSTTTAQYKPKVDPSGGIWLQISKAIAKIPQKPGQFTTSRVTGYAQNPKIVVNDNRADMANEAADVEREQMLQPVTKALLTYAPVAAEKYLLWQKESTPLVEARSAQKVQTGVNVALGILSVASMAAGAYSGNAMATQAGSQSMITASNNIRIASEKIVEINKTLATASRAFDEYKGGSLTVRLFGKVYQLNGGLAQQQAEFRKIVAEQLAKTAD